jgi:hypothetical protein
MASSDLDRFLSHTERDPDTGCLLWTRSTSGKGYGRFKTRDGKRWLAHRWIFLEKYGYLPPVVMHDCDTPPCVDWVNCLKPGTQLKNQQDMTRKGRGRTGLKNGKAAMPDAMAREIRDEYAKGILTLQMLADVYGCGKTTVARIVRAEGRWSNLSTTHQEI